MTIIYLIRHGESIKNTLKIVQGDEDDEANVLSTRGTVQVEKLKKKLKAIHADAIYSSPTTRAYMTAKIIAQGRGVDIQTDKQLMEKGKGKAIHNMDVDQMLAQYGDWDEMTEDERLDSKIVSDEESQRELLARTLRTVKKIANICEDKTIFVVTHGQLLRSLYTYLIGASLKDKWKFSNCGYLKLEVDGDEMKILETHDLHLKTKYP